MEAVGEKEVRPRSVLKRKKEITFLRPILVHLITGLSLSPPREPGVKHNASDVRKARRS